MKKFTAIFVADKSFLGRIVGGVIKTVTDSKFAHVAMKLEINGVDVVVETMQPTMFIHDGNIYDNDADYEYIERLEIILNDVQHEMIVAKIQQLLSEHHSYGLVTDCLAGGLASVFGDAIGSEFVEHIDACKQTLNCSETYTLVLRAAFENFAGDIVADIVTPERAYEETNMYFFNR